LCTICIDDQRDIGVAAGVAGSVRSIIATFASTIYQVVLSARLRKTIPSIVPAALVAAGLPGSSVPGFITALSTGNTKALQALEGFTPAILGIGARAYKVANADAYRTVFLVSIGFSVLATLSSFFIPNVDDLMTMEVTTTLHSRKDHRVVGAERTKIDTHGDAAA
jgi:hypothetical protein